MKNQMMSPKMRPTAAAPSLVCDDWSSKLSILSLPLSTRDYYRRRPFSLEAEPSEALLVGGRRTEAPEGHHSSRREGGAGGERSPIEVIDYSGHARKRATTVPERNPLLDTDWEPLLSQEFEKPYMAKLKEFVAEERSRYSIYPPHDEVFTALPLTPYAETKVVILGQDPYHGDGQAHGLAFSVRHGVRSPPSLVNIHRELHDDLGVPTPDHGNLEPWGRRGVLLLNATLTVRAGEPRSHWHKGWETFTDQVIRTVAAKTDSVVFILWGREARRKKALINTSRHTVICSSHPSPQSAYRGPKPFFRSKPFSAANHALLAAGRTGVDWRLTE